MEIGGHNLAQDSRFSIEFMFLGPLFQSMCLQPPNRWKKQRSLIDVIDSWINGGGYGQRAPFSSNQKNHHDHGYRFSPLASSELIREPKREIWNHQEEKSDCWSLHAPDNRAPMDRVTYWKQQVFLLTSYIDGFFAVLLPRLVHKLPHLHPSWRYTQSR